MNPAVHVNVNFYGVLLANYIKGWMADVEFSVIWFACQIFKIECEITLISFLTPLFHLKWRNTEYVFNLIWSHKRKCLFT